MPCYTAWYEYITPGTPEYAMAKKEVEAKLLAIKHIINHYYKAFSHTLPLLPSGVKIDPHRQPRSHREFELRKIICHHFACDGINISILYDAASILDETNNKDRSYLAVILPCASLMRKNIGMFTPSY